MKKLLIVLVLSSTSLFADNLQPKAEETTADRVFIDTLVEGRPSTQAMEGYLGDSSGLLEQVRQILKKGTDTVPFLRK